MGAKKIKFFIKNVDKFLSMFYTLFNERFKEDLQMEMREVYNQGRQRGESILKAKNSKQIEIRISQIKHDLTILEYDHEYLEAAGLRGELSVYYQNGFTTAFPPKAKF